MKRSEVIEDNGVAPSKASFSQFCNHMGHVLLSLAQALMEVLIVGIELALTVWPHN